VAVVTALVHLFVYVGLTGYLAKPGVGFLIAMLALPVLGLHLLIFAVARFSGIWGGVVALVLNVGLAFAGWIWWSMQINQASISNKAAAENAAIFMVIGLATAALLIGWLRFTRPRVRSAQP
jgi:hypothetical protein